MSVDGLELLAMDLECSATVTSYKSLPIFLVPVDVTDVNEYLLVAHGNAAWYPALRTVKQSEAIMKLT